jgi:hypothetical protein
MKAHLGLSLLVTAALLGSGCKTYVYRVVQPAQASRMVIADRPLTIHYEPLDYSFHRDHDRLVMHIINPTDDRLTVQGNRSYVVDPQGESHPLRARVIGPHSHAVLLLPPPPITAQTVGGYGPGWGWGGGWGWGWGWGPGIYNGFYGDWFYGPPVTYYTMVTPYDWKWKEGPVRLRLSYEREAKTFAHDFELVREPEKSKK